MLRFIFSVIFIFSIFIGHSQTNKYFDDIKKTFDDKTQNELIKISKELTKAQKDFETGKKFSADNISKAISSSKKASAVFAENYRKLFMIYENKLTALIKDTDGKQKIYFEKKMQDAKNGLSSAIYNRLVAKKEKDDKKAYALLHRSHQDEISAIDDLSEIFALINGWETSNYVVEKENYNTEETYKNNNTAGFKARNFVVNDPNLENNYKFNHKQFIGNEKNNISNFANSNSSTNYNTNKNNNYYSSTDSGSGKVHEFKIQIGTSILPASQAQIKRLNKTDLPVNTYKSSVYYKYTVGNFSDFQEAKNFKNAYGLTNVYIVEYRKGKEVKFYMKDYQ
ncbi:MAG: hypothetical protein L3J56_05395 [Bacteroidales bacterium]|nr:hypothetical protein [Bacteroidales bacterium]